MNQRFLILMILTGLAIGFEVSGQPSMATLQEQSQPPYVGLGARVGEVDATQASVQFRLTATPEQLAQGTFPGAEGWARVTYANNSEFQGVLITDWRRAVEHSDYYLQFDLTDLIPWTRYYYRIETRETMTAEVRQSRIFSFNTAPKFNVRQDIRFQVTTCQDHLGLPTYDHMLAQKPNFAVSAGDTVYYDHYNARTVEDAYALYHKEYGTPWTKRYFGEVAAYFQKDDHDYRFNDADPFVEGRWHHNEKPGQYMSDVWADPLKDKLDTNWLTHEEGIDIFNTVFPSSDKPYRTFRWGKGVQIWLLEGRDYRSSNKEEDGPEKTIWGAEQKRWLKATLKESDADFRVIISPTPIVGPDRQSKFDSHANKGGFRVEGLSFLNWLIDEDLYRNTVLVCGDRHWQYHSSYRDKVQEFCSGPTSHAKVQTPAPSRDAEIVVHYSNGTGGFLTVDYKQSTGLALQHFGEKGELYNSYIMKLPGSR